jgi:hypothetical protein
MDEETQTPSEPAKAKPSQVPSWVTLGFVLGALFVMALPKRGGEEARPRPPAGDAVAAKPAKPAAARPITTIEAVFAAWDKYAVWSNNTTEVALWNTDTMNYSDCYEVLRTADGYYFRSIPSLTRPVLTHGVVQESPLQFTETARQRQEWLGEVDRENLKALSEAARQTLPVLTEEPEKK